MKFSHWVSTKLRQRASEKWVSDSAFNSNWKQAKTFFSFLRYLQTPECSGWSLILNSKVLINKKRNLFSRLRNSKFSKKWHFFGIFTLYTYFYWYTVAKSKLNVFLFYSYKHDNWHWSYNAQLKKVVSIWLDFTFDRHRVQRSNLRDRRIEQAKKNVGLAESLFVSNWLIFAGVSDTLLPSSFQCLSQIRQSGKFS